MAKDKTFNLRLDADDRARLDMIAEHYSAPAATAVRILIKREADRLCTRPCLRRAYEAKTRKR